MPLETLIIFKASFLTETVRFKLNIPLHDGVLDNPFLDIIP